MCGALTTSSPAASTSAQEKSRRSLTFVDTAVRRSRSPICRATAAKRWVNSSSWTASGRMLVERYHGVRELEDPLADGGRIEHLQPWAEAQGDLGGLLLELAAHLHPRPTLPVHLSHPLHPGEPARGPEARQHLRMDAEGRVEARDRGFELGRGALPEGGEVEARGQPGRLLQDA